MSMLTGLILAYIKMYGCDVMWKCKNSGLVCMQIVNRNVLVLVIFLIISFSFNLLGNDNALELFSFASTLTSIILSVLAIMMTINSEEKNERIKASVESALVGIENSTCDLKGIAKNFDNISDRFNEVERMSSEIASNTRNYGEMLDSLREILEHVKHIDSNFSNQKINNSDTQMIDFENQEGYSNGK